MTNLLYKNRIIKETIWVYFQFIWEIIEVIYNYISLNGSHFKKLENILMVYYFLLVELNYFFYLL